MSARIEERNEPGAEGHVIVAVTPAADTKTPGRARPGVILAINPVAGQAPVVLSAGEAHALAGALRRAATRAQRKVDALRWARGEG